MNIKDAVTRIGISNFQLFGELGLRGIRLHDSKVSEPFRKSGIASIIVKEIGTHDSRIGTNNQPEHSEFFILETGDTNDNEVLVLVATSKLLKPLDDKPNQTDYIWNTYYINLNNAYIKHEKRDKNHPLSQEQVRAVKMLLSTTPLF